ncbi:MAG: phosphoglucosamine mutase [Planctomycetaceae bacterium]|jgi:phosphomannomutase|nr:phosphoglucosamine mutase [Planctomycetaceae bacterium]
MSDLIITVSGLRGTIGETLTPDVAMRYASAFSHETAASGAFIITRDGRGSGKFIADAIHSALNACGRSTIDAGVAATPTTGIIVRKLGAAGGLQITASHNPAQYNGIKLFSESGRVIPKTAGAAVLERYNSNATSWKKHDEIGNRSACLPDVFRQHLDAVLASVDADAIRAKNFKVVLDSNRGAGSTLGQLLLAELRCRFEVIGATADGKFEHTPEPTENNLTSICKEACGFGADIVFCQDPDADRLAIIDAGGRYIGEEYTVAICAEHVLRTQCNGKHPSKRVKGALVINYATSRMTEDIAAKYGVQCHRSAVGEANVVDMMIDKNAAFGGEGNGGPIDPKIGMVRDSFVGMAMLLDAMAAREATAAELAGELPSYAIVKRKMQLPPEKIAKAIDKIETKIKGKSKSRLDGLRIEFDDAWLLVRASNTEPIVRTIAEAPTEAKANQLCDEAEAILGE